MVYTSGYAYVCVIVFCHGDNNVTKEYIKKPMRIVFTARK